MDKEDSVLDGDLRLSLVQRHGYLLGGEPLWRLLGYSSVDAFRKAVERGHAPVRTFCLPHRRGRFARTTDVADWLTQQLADAPVPEEGGAEGSRGD